MLPRGRLASSLTSGSRAARADTGRPCPGCATCAAESHRDAERPRLPPPGSGPRPSDSNQLGPSTGPCAGLEPRVPSLSWPDLRVPFSSEYPQSCVCQNFQWRRCLHRQISGQSLSQRTAFPPWSDGLSRVNLCFQSKQPLPVSWRPRVARFTAPLPFLPACFPRLRRPHTRGGGGRSGLPTPVSRGAGAPLGKALSTRMLSGEAGGCAGQGRSAGREQRMGSCRPARHGASGPPSAERAVFPPEALGEQRDPHQLWRGQTASIVTLADLWRQPSRRRRTRKKILECPEGETERQTWGPSRSPQTPLLKPAAGRGGSCPRRGGLGLPAAAALAAA